MTTLLLSQKLLTMQLDKGEFEKIKWLRIYNTQEKNKAVDSLKSIIDNQLSLQTCRLCLKPGGNKIFGGDQDFDVANNIKYILGIEILQDDGKPQHICSICESTVRMAAQLKQVAETTQWRLQQELNMVAETSEYNEDESDTYHGGYFNLCETKVTREWTCGKCKRIFHNRDDFSEHEKLPSCRTTISYVCEICGQKVKSLTRLKRHRLTHTGDLHFPCTRCPYRARTKYALTMHERSHTGDRPVRCPLCPATFTNSSNLASHKRSHMPPKFHCDLCQRGFKFKEALNNHMATQHSNSKPYNCSSCGKPFATRKLTLRHELKVHNRPKLRSGIIPSYIKLQQEETGT